MVVGMRTLLMLYSRCHGVSQVLQRIPHTMLYPSTVIPTISVVSQVPRYIVITGAVPNSGYPFGPAPP